MFRGILPKEFAFYDYFDKLVDINVSVSEEFLNLALENADFNEHAKKIRELEHDADKISHTCIEALHRTFITPIERTDIYTLVKRLDDVADHLNAAVTRMLLYDITSLRPEAVEFAKILVECSRDLAAAVKSLRHIHDAEFIKDKCRNVHFLENKADNILREALSNIFKEGDAMLVIKWKEIFERLEKAVDRCETLANIIEGILIDNA